MNEEQQDISTNPERAEAVIGNHGLQANYRFVECASAADVGYIDAGLDNSMHLRSHVRRCLDHPIPSRRAG
jgi:hypothetical protein